MTAIQPETPSVPDSGDGGRYTDTLRALDGVHTMARDWLLGLEQRPVAVPVTRPEMAARFADPLPEESSDPTLALPDWFQRAEPGLIISAGPRFFGWVQSGATPAALAGDWFTSLLDQNAFGWDASPAANMTEFTVLRWLKELFHLPQEWDGVLTSGATMANLVCLVAARQWAGRKLGFNAAVDGLSGNPRIHVVASDHLHSTTLKTLGTLGIGRNAITRVSAPGGMMDPAALRETLAGIDEPVIVISSAAEVNTGAFDDINAVADACEAHGPGAWLHVDGAFGLFAAASPQWRHLTHGIERADSVGSDAHKWLNVPYDCGFAFVRDSAAWLEAFSVAAAYIDPTGDAAWEPHQHLPEMSRRFRALAVWCSLRALGRSGYQAVVERSIANAQVLATWLADTPGLELMAPAHLNIVAFRFVQDDATDDKAARDDLNRRATLLIQRSGRVFCTPSVWEGEACIRAAFDNWSTTPADVQVLQDVLRGVSAQLATRADDGATDGSAARA